MSACRNTSANCSSNWMEAMNKPKEQVDLLLRDIAVNKDLLQACQDRATADIQKINQRYAPEIKRLSGIVDAGEKKLERLVKKNRSTILDGEDRADLSNGSVMLKTERRVKQIKGMLKKLKAAGLTVAIKVAREVVDWDCVQKFNDATLERLGTKRIEKDLFSYELKPPKSRPVGPAQG